RHATSKVDSLAALESVASLGFRGEALASIASVAATTLTSRAVDAERGYVLQPAGSSEPRPAAHPPGTTVDVRELFARVPARRKFLRTATTEFKHIRKAVERIALSRPDVAFTLRHDGREVFRLAAAHSAAQDRARIARLCGEAFDEHALVVDAEAADMRLTGWIASPGFSRSQADLQFAYVNRRAIRDKVFNHAVKLAYRDVLHNQRQPAFVLYLAMPERQVDVNAHPAKAEVRFRESQLVHDFVFRSLARVLQVTADAPEQTQHVSLPTRPMANAAHPGATRSPLEPRPNGTLGQTSGWAAPAQSRLHLTASESAAAYQFQQPPERSTSPAQEAAEQSHVQQPDASTPALGYAIGQL